MLAKILPGNNLRNTCKGAKMAQCAWNEGQRCQQQAMPGDNYCKGCRERANEEDRYKFASRRFIETGSVRTDEKDDDGQLK
jgi:hypothetical protein